MAVSTPLPASDGGSIPTSPLHSYRIERAPVDAVRDFIQQHHGNSLVYYFYRRALEELEEDHEVKEEGFRYPGPRPRTKEVAIVLLADSVEAAGRALREPSKP